MKISEGFRLAIIIALCELVGVVSAYFTSGSITEWYATLVRPEFAPPDWVFAPAWVALYALMGLAVYLIWRGRRSKQRSQALFFFMVQLALNGAWTPVFFGLRNPQLGFVVIVALWVAIGSTIIAFFRLRPAAALLLLPYLAWVSFAALLNYSIWQLN